MNTFPSSLQTPTAAEGYALACDLAARALAERRSSVTNMAAHLASGSMPSIEALTAAYFQAVAVANSGWAIERRGA